jgi:hypothetical protein
MTESVILFCPYCGSAAISCEESPFPALRSSDKASYTCNVCDWHGTREEVVASSFSHDWQNNEAILSALVGYLRHRLALDIGKIVLQYLLDWGFMSSPEPTLLARYLSAMATGMVKAMLEERVAIEKEKANA